MRSLHRTVSFKNFSFSVWDNVYAPAEDSALFAENLNVEKGAAVLDVGTGCGILAILAAEKAASVVAIDVNPYAIRCAKQNSKLNNTQNKMYFVQGDLFSPLKVGIDFDMILFNAPYLSVEEDEGVSWIERAWCGGTNGRKIIDRFIRIVSEYLKPGGQVFLMQSTSTGLEETLTSFEIQCLTASVVATRNLPFFETLLLVKAQKRE